MKHSQLIGIIASLAVIGICFLPWTFITSENITVTGLYSGNTNFGKPGLLNIILCIQCIIFFLVPKGWAKRINIFLGAINFAWCMRNYLLLTTCLAGECPQKKTGLFLLLITGFLILIMTFIPKIKMTMEEK